MTTVSPDQITELRLSRLTLKVQDIVWFTDDNFWDTYLDNVKVESGTIYSSEIMRVGSLAPHVIFYFVNCLILMDQPFSSKGDYLARNIETLNCYYLEIA